jgi:hypothetical protein
MPTEPRKSASGRRTPRLSKQMIDAIIAYGDDRSESNFDRLKELIVRLAARHKRDDTPVEAIDESSSVDTATTTPCEAPPPD